MTVEVTQTTTETPSVHADASSTGLEVTALENVPEPHKGGKEARYRVERNTARDALTASEARVEQLQTNELERIAGGTISNPSDLLTMTGKALADFLVDGELDPELVSEAAAELLSTRPRLSKNSPAFDPTQGSGGAGKPKPTWGSLLQVG
jgi:hypothetical protein